jgi:hypothetical protein
MRMLSKIMCGITLASVISACYVAPPHRYYAYRSCNAGWYWDGYHCHRHW